jgi:5-methylcytosine-specific restriction protein A
MPDRIVMIRPARGTAKIKKRPDARPNAYRRGYCDSRHFAWRQAVLLRDNWQCRECGAICGRSRQAHADHVIPVVVRPDLRYDVANGQCLCHSCHSRKTATDQCANFGVPTEKKEPI